STPGIAYPVIAWPAWRSSPSHTTPGFLGDIASVGEVSVRPYPEMQVQPSLSSTSRTKIGDEAAPPIVMVFRLLKSYFCLSGEFTSAVTMVGTKAQEQARSRSINRNTSAGAK